MKSFIVLCVLALVCSTWANPPESNALSRHRRQLGAEILENAGKLVEKLVSDLKKAADNAKDAMVQFNNGILEQGQKVREKFADEINKLRDRVTLAIKNLQDKVASSGSGVRECVQGLQEKAESVFNDAKAQTKSCADEKIQEAAEHLKNLAAIDADGHKLAQDTYAEMRKCMESSNIVSTSACLGRVAFRAEVNTAQFLLQSGFAIGRENLNLATLPAALEVCAGSSLVNAGVATGRVLVEVGTCSKDAVLDNFKFPEQAASSSAVSANADIFNNNDVFSF